MIKIEKAKLAKEVLFFNDGDEILSYINERGAIDLPEIILLDINMPSVDGLDFLDLYKDVVDNKKAAIKIYMISSSINPDDVRRAEQSQFVIDYITKPIRDIDINKIFHNQKNPYYLGVFIATLGIGLMHSHCYDTGNHYKRYGSFRGL